MTNNEVRGGSPPGNRAGAPPAPARPLAAGQRPGPRGESAVRSPDPAPASRPRTAAIYSRGSTAPGAAAHPPAGSPAPGAARAAPGPRRPPRSCRVGGGRAAFAFGRLAQRTPPSPLAASAGRQGSPGVRGRASRPAPAAPARAPARPPPTWRCAGPGRGQGAPRPRCLPTSSAAAPGKPRPAGFLPPRAGGRAGGRAREPAQGTEPKLRSAGSPRAEGRGGRGPPQASSYPPAPPWHLCRELGRAPGHGAEARSAGRGGAAGPDGARALAARPGSRPSGTIDLAGQSEQIPGRAPGGTGGHSPCHGRLWDRASQAQRGRDVQEVDGRGTGASGAPGQAVHTLHRRSCVPRAPGVVPCAGQRPG